MPTDGDEAPPKKNYSIADLVRQRASDGHLSVSRQIFESLLLRLLTGNGPGYYQMAGFWRESIPWADKCGHLSAKKYTERLAQLNPDDYRKISQHKVPEKGMLTLLGFATPEFLGYLHRRNGRTKSGQSLTNGADVVRLFAEQKCGRACFKLVEGWAGRGFETVDVVQNNGKTRFRRLSDGELEDPEQFCAQRLEGEGAIIERYLDQHPDLAHFNPGSVNTLRIWVLEPENGPAKTTLAYLRVGRSGSLVDNQSSGGIVAPIDLDTGRVGVAIDGLSSRREFPVHPDHGAQIDGRQLPYFEESKLLAESCLAAFPRVRFAGLDIAVGKDGPVVLELNMSPDREGAAFVGVPTEVALSD